MRAKIVVMSLLGIMVFSAPVLAEDFSGTTVVIPVVMHGPGKLGTVWVTDVWIGNHSSVEQTIQLEFFPTGGSPVTATVTLGTYSLVALPDVVLSTFGFDDAKGMLILTTDTSSRFNAQARIYNVGNPAGEFGQFVPGFGLQELGRQAYVYGLSGVDGNRTNIGIANPTDQPLEVSLSLTAADNSTMGGRTVTVGPESLLQINDIFSDLGVAPGDVMQLVINGSGDDKFYGYASVVRDDTGDAIFLPGLSVNTGPY